MILRDEIGHVLIGNHWFRHLCEEADLDPHPTYARLAEQYHAPKLRGPFNFEARRDAGFDEAELAELAALAVLKALRLPRMVAPAKNHAARQSAPTKPSFNTSAQRVSQLSLCNRTTILF
ncbi:MAG: FIG00005326: uncharacterized protein [uncultured Paraburkholderia sp.]|nr:MAG: FIG00005326: uncharacterized protein [uncultured Paraburkholderia sp.]CAH2933780.1 MAG: FIG00005326: uncharacterized protein [uncultured Paraburkholderia sp.]